MSVIRSSLSKLMLALCATIPCILFAGSNWFPFSPSGPAAAGSAVDASSLLIDYPGQDVSTIIDARGHLHAAADGHFYFNGTGRRAKFFGLNFMVNTIFPPTVDAPQQPGEYRGIVPPDAADQLAVRLARMGVNIVRLHFIDGGYTRPVSIWDAAYPNSTRHFDPLQVSRLDYLIFRLKQHGIYCDVNLHAGRVFRSEDGVRDYDKFPDLAFNKPATQFDPTMIQLQQEYASNLLNHVNPYTRLRLADDPAIAFVEISNEDSMLYSFANDQLSAIANVSQCMQGMSCVLPPSYSLELDHLWNAWLKNKYVSDAGLAAAWNPSSEHTEVLNDDLASASSVRPDWILRLFNGASGSVSSEPSSTSRTGRAARIDVQATSGTIWEAQLDRAGLSFQNGHLYDLSISIKGTAGTKLRVDLLQDQSPYTFYQVVGTFGTTQAWQTVTTTFRANITNAGHVQLNLNVGAAVGTVWIGKVSVTPHPASALLPGESLALQSVARQTTARLSTFTVARNRDLHQFYYETERLFFDGMNNYLRNTLGVKSMLTGTAVFGLPLNADLASHQDFIDEHVYPDYPLLTDTAGALSAWTIANRSFSKDPFFLLFTWASLAVKGKPFTVTESDEPFPSDYAVEWLPWLTTFANFQDWDALMPKMYGNWPDNYFATTPPGWTGNHFFAIGGNPIASAQFPVASRVFLSSQNAPAASQTALQANRTDLLEGDPTAVTGQFFGANGYAAWQALVHSVRASYDDVPSSRTTYVGDPPSVITSDHGELTLDRSTPDTPVYKASSPYLQAITGFLAGKTVDMPNLSITASAATAPFASITLQSIDNQPLVSSQRLLLSVLTRYENTGMIWNANRTSLGSNWGTDPSLIEPMAATYTLRLNRNSRFSVYALDAQGNRTRQVGGGQGDIHLSLDTGADQTVWYEVVSDGPAATILASDQFYYLVAQHSGRCLDLPSGPSAANDGVKLQQWTCWGGDNQQWKFIPASQGGYQIVSKVSGKGLDVAGGPFSVANGVPIQQWTLWGGLNQVWNLVTTQSSLELVSGSSGLCLDVIGGPSATDNGVGLQQWFCWGGLNQRWNLVPVN